MKQLARAALITAAMMGMSLPGAGNAVALLNGFGGSAGYGELAMSPNDDGSSNQIALPFEVDFFGTSYSSFYINNNGNVTFNSSVGTYTPQPFPVSSQPMIAPFWGDVDTRCGTCGAVYVAEGQTNTPNDTVVVTWNNVGYYPSSSSLTNDFQLVLRARPDTGAGNFDIDFRYNNLNWTTGSASGGSGGLGGIEAQAGFDAGNGIHFLTLPGSQTPAVLDLATTSNVSASTPGLWTFPIRNGAVPDGSSPSNPLLPVVTNDGFNFDFGVVLNTMVFIDPPVAVGYVYEVQSGPNIASVLLPTGIGDGLYQLTYNDGTGDVTVALAGGSEHFFQSGGVDAFTVLGIETTAGIDPTDPLAFVTGLTFVATGQVQMTQTPITVNSDTNNGVPEPGTLSLLAGALIGMAMTSRRRNLHTECKK